ncbi:MAG TPA: hypothetical protein VMU33_06130 [Burkholderiaceae bacterium]|nr:hypothetical protein [Burkholderiaceae bacterium]
MNAVLKISAVLSLVLAAAAASAHDGSSAYGDNDYGMRRVSDDRDHDRKHDKFCHEWFEYLEHYGETEYFEYKVERSFREHCKRFWYKWEHREQPLDNSNSNSSGTTPQPSSQPG